MYGNPKTRKNANQNTDSNLNRGNRHGFATQVTRLMVGRVAVAKVQFLKSFGSSTTNLLKWNCVNRAPPYGGMLLNPTKQ